ncbi:hypothetical protein ACWCPF_05650 [Streptomyces sp. NPDC001858]
MLDTQAVPPVLRDGVIKDRSWGRERRKPIWHFEVLFDGDTATRVFGPGHIAVGIENAQKEATDGE